MFQNLWCHPQRCILSNTEEFCSRLFFMTVIWGGNFLKLPIIIKNNIGLDSSVFLSIYPWGWHCNYQNNNEFKPNLRTCVITDCTVTTTGTVWDIKTLQCSFLITYKNTAVYLCYFWLELSENDCLCNTCMTPQKTN